MHFFCCIAVNFEILVANFTIFQHEKLNVNFSFGAFKAIKKKSLEKKGVFSQYPQIKIRANSVSRFLPANVLVGEVREDSHMNEQAQYPLGKYFHVLLTSDIFSE